MGDLTAFAYGEQANDETLRYMEKTDYHRCNWLVTIDDSTYLCLLMPHEGDIHKVMDHTGLIKTRQVHERPKWKFGMSRIGFH